MMQNLTNLTADAEVEDTPVQRLGAYERFLECLMQRTFRPGRLVTQRDICDATGCTITAVREALKRLEGEGIVELIAKKGVMLREVDADEVREIYQLRRLIELPAVREYAESHDPKEVKTLRKLALDVLNADPQTIEERRALAHRRTTLDWDMHLAFSKALNSKLIDKIFRNLETKQFLVRLQLPAQYLNRGEAFFEHLEILDAIAAKDPKKASELMEAHLLAAEQRFVDTVVY